LTGTPDRANGRVLLGVITGAHGIRGEVKVETFTESPAGIGAYGPLASASGKELRIAQMRAGKADEAVVRFEGVADRNAAEALKGTELFVPRSALGQPAKNEFFLTDLIGLRAEDAAGAVLGTVQAVHNFGAGDVLEIAPDRGESTFVPFTDDAVPFVDVPAGRIVVQPPNEID
jgi:16S rRNA processing protein RimM